MGVGDRVRQIRQEKGITQKDLAQLSGVCQQMISKLEVGKAQGSANIVRLALALDVSPAWLEGISPRKTTDYTKSVPANGTLNRKAVHACIEYLSSKAGLLEAYNFRRQAELFTACYELCTQQKNRKLTKTSLISMLSRRVKGL